jgi:diacylglycerol kinase
MKSFFNSFIYALRGVKFAIETGRNMRIHILSLVLVIIAGFYFHLSPIEWCVVCICSAMVLAAEIFNTAIERLVDYVSDKHTKQAANIKDAAAGAVLVCAVFALVIACLIFLPKIFICFE